jgi:hypothetical protein
MPSYSGLTTVSYGDFSHTKAVYEPFIWPRTLTSYGGEHCSWQVPGGDALLKGWKSKVHRSQPYTATTILIHTRVVRRQNNPCVILSDEPLLQ